VIGPTVSEYYGLIRLPNGHQLPYFFFRLSLPASAWMSLVTVPTYADQEPSGPPKFLVFLSTHATLYGRPRQALGALTKAGSLHGLLVPLDHRHLL